mgnify:CR=1 FL=1
MTDEDFETDSYLEDDGTLYVKCSGCEDMFHMYKGDYKCSRCNKIYCNSCSYSDKQDRYFCYKCWEEGKKAIEDIKI